MQSISGSKLLKNFSAGPATKSGRTQFAPTLEIWDCKCRGGNLPPEKAPSDEGGFLYGWAIIRSANIVARLRHNGLPTLQL